jgi:hypothetical protein
MAYTTPPGSGNAYSRNFVHEVFGFSPSIPQSDAVLLTIAPLMGDVLTIRKPLARYRLHDKSYSAMPSLDASKLRERLYQDIEKARFFASVARERGLPVSPDPLRYSLNHLQYRLASYLVEPCVHPFSEDTMLGLVSRLVLSATMSSQMRLRDRAILVAWAIACVLVPRDVRRNFVVWRFAPMLRPRVIQTLLGMSSSLRSPRLPDRP